MIWIACTVAGVASAAALTLSIRHRHLVHQAELRTSKTWWRMCMITAERMEKAEKRCAAVEAELAKIREDIECASRWGPCQ